MEGRGRARVGHGARTTRRGPCSADPCGRRARGRGRPPDGLARPMANVATRSELAHPDRPRAVARVRALGKDETAALVEGGLVRPDDLPRVPFGIQEVESATAEREVLRLGHDADAVESL